MLLTKGLLQAQSLILQDETCKHWAFLVLTIAEGRRLPFTRGNRLVGSLFIAAVPHRQSSLTSKTRFVYAVPTGVCPCSPPASNVLAAMITTFAIASVDEFAISRPVA